MMTAATGMPTGKKSPDAAGRGEAGSMSAPSPRSRSVSLCMSVSVERGQLRTEDEDMLGKTVSENGNFVSEDKMSSAALKESKQWFDELMSLEFRGRGDREKSARGRLAENLGVPEQWLIDLQYKSAEKRDVRGALYRALLLGKRKYEALCQVNEEAADQHRADRMKLRGNHEAADEKPAAAGVGMGSSDH